MLIHLQLQHFGCKKMCKYGIFVAKNCNICILPQKFANVFFLWLKFTNTRSAQALRDILAVSASTPTPDQFALLLSKIEVHFYFCGKDKAQLEFCGKDEVLQKETFNRNLCKCQNKCPLSPFVKSL